MPSMRTGVVIGGSGVIGAMVWRPGPGISNLVVFVPPMAALESRIACRREPGPLSAAVETTKTPLVMTIWNWDWSVEAPTARATRISVLETGDCANGV